MWFKNKPSDLTFPASALTHIRFDFDVKVSTERLFEILSTGEQQTIWAEGYVRTLWHTPPPHGVGTVRDIVLKSLSVQERFLCWDYGKRFAFSADALTLPLARQLMEDIQFEALSPTRSRLVWNVYYTPVFWLRPLNGILTKYIFRPMFHSFSHGFVQYAEQYPSGFTGQ